MLLLAAALFLAEPAPLDMPRAEAYLVRETGRLWLEDRFNRLDLWTSRAVDGRWTDEDGRTFTLATLAWAPPAAGRDSTVTRAAFAASRRKIDKRQVTHKSSLHAEALRDAIGLLAPIPLPEKGSPPRQLPRGFDDVDYWHGTNVSAVVCAFLPEKSEVWRLAVWEVLPGDDFEECVKTFEREFLYGGWAKYAEKGGAAADAAVAPADAGERELLRADARHSVAAYDGWRTTDAAEFSVLDDLRGDGSAIAAITNELSVFRRKYADAIPTKIDGTNALCVARIFADRAEYEEALVVGGREELQWSAAYWSQERRELVAYLPPDGLDSLLKTIRHEAFHQFLSYATSMIPASPWFNEGYAQYFEDESSLDWPLFDGSRRPSQEELESLAKLIPAVLQMDYAQFYSGTQSDRRLNYALARSIAVFIEKGARLVRHDPFATLKADYIDALFSTQDMRQATAAAFRSADRLSLFVAEWLKFWKAR